MIVTFKDNGVAKLADYDDTDTVKISLSLHNHSVRMQYLEYFNGLIGSDSDNATIGAALEKVSKKKFYSRVTRVEFHPGKTLKDFSNVKRK